jgi:hypothetical protein
MGVKVHEIDFSYSGRENSEKSQERARGGRPALPPRWYPLEDFTLTAPIMNGVCGFSNP